MRSSSSDEEESEEEEEEEEEEGVALLFLFLLRFLAGFAGAIVVEFMDTAAFVTTISALPWLSEMMSANQYQCALLIAPTAQEAISSHLVPISRHQAPRATSQQPYLRLVLGTLRLGRLFFDDQVQTRRG